MKAVVFEKFGGPDVLVYKDVPTPEPQGDEILIRAEAISINPIDWKIRSGAVKDRIPVKPPDILGRDVAGIVAVVGPRVTDVKVGDRVMAFTDHTYAEFVAAKHVEYCPIPESMDAETAAALPLVCATGSQLIENAIQLQPGQSVLVTGALGAVGRVAVYVAKQLGARVFAGVRKSQKEEARTLGADEVIAIDNPQELDLIRNLDAVADTVGGDQSEGFLRTLKRDGVYGTVVGPPKNADDYEVRIAPMSAVQDRERQSKLAAAAARGEFTIPIGARYSLSQAREAHQALDDKTVHGKVLLIP